MSITLAYGGMSDIVDVTLLLNCYPFVALQAAHYVCLVLSGLLYVLGNVKHVVRRHGGRHRVHL